jgi:integrase/recombinase XerD
LHKIAFQDHNLSFMANIKTLLDLRRAKSNGTFNIIFRIIDFKKVYTINSGIALQQHYWDERKGQVVKEYPNAKLLNIKLSKHFLVEMRLIINVSTNRYMMNPIVLGFKNNVIRKRAFTLYVNKLTEKDKDIKEYLLPQINLLKK